MNIGDIVETLKFGYSGIVMQVHEDLVEGCRNNRTMSAEEWFNKQEPAMHPALKSQPWVSILTFPTGSVLVPISDVKLLAPMGEWTWKLRRREQNPTWFIRDFVRDGIDCDNDDFRAATDWMDDVSFRREE